jgi:hypothetical protein
MFSDNRQRVAQTTVVVAEFICLQKGLSLVVHYDWTLEAYPKVNGVDINQQVYYNEIYILDFHRTVNF